MILNIIINVFFQLNIYTHYFCCWLQFLLFVEHFKIYCLNYSAGAVTTTNAIIGTDGALICLSLLWLFSGLKKNAFQCVQQSFSNFFQEKNSDSSKHKISEEKK